MSLEINGKIVQIMDAVTGQGNNGPWTKREFVIETADQYPKKICFVAWNDKATILERLADGAQVKVSFDASSREYNQRWYTELRIWKLEMLGGQAPAPGAPAQNQAAPIPQEKLADTFGSDENENDLPF